MIGTIVLSWALDLGAYMHVLGAIPRGLPYTGLPEERRHALRKVFGKKAYHDTLEDVLEAYRRHAGAEER